MSFKSTSGYTSIVQHVILFFRIIERQQFHLHQQLEATEELKTTSFDGKLLWKLQLPSSGAQGQVRSPSFYTGRPGYKISVMLELSGHQECGESFTSFFLNLEKGRFDSQLCFPFSAVCSVMVINQRERGSRSTEETSVEECSAVMSCSQIPGCPDANSSVSSQKGRLKFFKTDKLMKYAKNGVLFIQVDCTHGVSSDASFAQQTPVKPSKKETETS